MRIPVLLLGLLMLSAASPPEPPPIPEILKPYVKDGLLVPGDFGWTRGYFSDASPADKAATDSIEAWKKKCLADGVAWTRAELAKMGVADPKLELTAGAPLLCRMYLSVPSTNEAGQTFAQFQDVVGRAMPMAETYLTAIKAAKDSLYPPQTFQAALFARPLAEQMLRRAWFWGQGEMKDVPPLAPPVQALFVRRLVMATAAEDFANTEWLKKIVAEKGWPKISDVGEGAALRAWLMVQHADADPVFQLQVLRLMEPLLAKGDVSKSNYAYLYDRIMLKLNGKQRYASQMMCENGKRQPSPLEDEHAVERYRSEMGMPALVEYMKQMDERLGPCPPA
ncbi:MAG: hypothetical protein J7494_14845 [Sphingobium sp.]|nr:hypothetical protein [Sphingobium sp.]